MIRALGRALAIVPAARLAGVVAELRKPLQT
jgi:hypothetical protein